MATDEMVTVPEAAETDTGGRAGILGSWWAIVLTALALGLALAWRFLAGPSPSAPTPDPPLYTGRAPGVFGAQPKKGVPERGAHRAVPAGHRASAAGVGGPPAPGGRGR